MGSTVSSFGFKPQLGKAAHLRSCPFWGSSYRVAEGGRSGMGLQEPVTSAQVQQLLQAIIAAELPVVWVEALLGAHSSWAFLSAQFCFV